jgi:hypothetical protein
MADRRCRRRHRRLVGRRYPGAGARDFGANGYEADREGRALNLSARRTTPLGGLPTTIRRLGGKRARQTLRPRARGIVHCRNYYYYHNYLLLLLFRRRTVQ